MQLPSNDALDSAAAWTITERRDPRTELEFTRHLLHSVLISLSPRPAGRWDPFDVQPQVFALDKFMALPVFTNKAYLQLFCRRFGITVRDPWGVLWASPTCGGVEEEAVQHRLSASAKLLTPCSEAEPLEDAVNPSEEPTVAGELTPDALFDVMSESAPPSGQAKSICKRQRRGKRLKKQRRSPLRGAVKNAPCRVPLSERRKKSKQHKARSGFSWEAEEAARQQQQSGKNAAFAAYLDTIQPFRVQQARPLSPCNPGGVAFQEPFCVGYFADIHTLLHNAAVLSPMIDIVLNPASPIELVLSREHTDQILHGGDGAVGSAPLLRRAYMRVERVLACEFSEFFRRSCPEVSHGWIACVPVPRSTTNNDGNGVTEPPIHTHRGGGPPTRVVKEKKQRNKMRSKRSRRSSRRSPSEKNFYQTRIVQQWRDRESHFSGGVEFEIVVLVESHNEAKTFCEIQTAKRQGRLIGHYSLDVIPLRLAAHHVKEAAHSFYESETSTEPEGANTAASEGTGFSNFRQMGESVTVNPVVEADDFFQDPSNVYGEPEGIFTESLKLRQRYREEL